MCQRLCILLLDDDGAREPSQCTVSEMHSNECGIRRKGGRAGWWRGISEDEADAVLIFGREDKSAMDKVTAFVRQRLKPTPPLVPILHSPKLRPTSYARPHRS